jgi:hypothetical protein
MSPFFDEAIHRQHSGAGENQGRDASKIQEVGFVSRWTELRAGSRYRLKLD